MKRLLPLSFTLLLLASPTLHASEDNQVVATAETTIRQKLLDPLQAKDEDLSEFSRRKMPPQARRVRMLDEHPLTDAQGQSFLSFAIDARHGFAGKKKADEDGWRKNTITGCVYPETGEVFVKLGNTIRPASVLLGKKTKLAEPHTCQSAQAQMARAD